MRRRTLLRRSVAAAVVGLAGCAGDPDESSPTPETTEPAETTVLPTTTGADETPSPTSSPTGTATDAATATDSPTATATPTDTPTATASPTATADQVVEVGAENSLRFEPDSFVIEAGATVLWRWIGGSHNVRPDSIPSDASWGGTPGGDGDTYGEGYTHSHTFEVPGEYEYYCSPHRSAGMTGSFTVE